MQPAPNVRLRVPPEVKPGEVFEVRAMIMHPMETGYRFDSQGTTIPIHIIRSFACKFEGETIFEARFGTSVSANPYLSFFARLERSGTLEFTWTDQDGDVYVHTAPVSVA